MQEESKELKGIYSMFRASIYVILFFEILMFTPIDLGPIYQFVVKILGNLGIFKSLLACKGAELLLVAITCTGTKAKKSLKFDVKKMVIVPLAIGLLLQLGCLLLHEGISSLAIAGIPVNRAGYAMMSIIGLFMIHASLDNIAKYFSHKLGEDRFNFENESFEQSTRLNSNKYSVNIPMTYYYKGRINKGWINVINPFRGTWVVGTPGSGKTFSVIEPFMRQHSQKGFSMVVYDYKYPTLARKLFYLYLKNRELGNTPKDCKFHVINFTDVENSNRVNPIQKKYIPDLAAASETAATLLESLQKGGKKQGGSEQFFQNSAENFLAAIIFFFVNFKPTGFKEGKPLHRVVEYQGERLYVITRKFSDYLAVRKGGEVVLDFIDHQGRNVSIDEDGVPVSLDHLSYMDSNNNMVLLGRSYYVDDKGIEQVPDTITGKYSDMPHVLSFLVQPYMDIFDVLVLDEEIQPLLAPFKSALENQAMDQLEGMAGTLRVLATRLITKESYWVFSGDDFDLKVSDPAHPSYLVIANDPEKEGVIGSLNALILNRLVTRVNSGYGKNVPVSIIVDELPTLYFHKIDRLIGTARSNKVAVTMGFQELPQLEADYGKNGMQKVITVCGNVICGSARNKETLEWLQNDIFGKVKQISKNISINDSRTSISLNERMDNLVPAAKIADMPTGWLCGQTARDFVKTDPNQRRINLEESEEFQTTKFFCKTNFDMDKIQDEESHYVELPKIYTFPSSAERDIALNKNYLRINNEVKMLIDELLDRADS